MKLTIIGATGNVGSRILSRALAAGHNVRVVARRPEAIAAAPNLSVIRGSATDSETIAQAAGTPTPSSWPLPASPRTSPSCRPTCPG